MIKIIVIGLFIVLTASGCASSTTNHIQSSTFRNYEPLYDYDDGYQWAEDNDVRDFDECQQEFGTSDAEDGCNEYIQENYSGRGTFGNYECTEDCSGHEAGYEWAEENDISDSYDCDGNSQSFNEGCETYVDENY